MKSLISEGIYGSEGYIRITEAEPQIDPELWDASPEYHELTKSTKHKPPKKSIPFVRKWMQIIPSIEERANFRAGHLLTLEILCDLYCEYDQLQKFIRERGQIYESEGRNGLAIRPYPQVAQLNKVIEQIRSYTVALGLVLKKDEGESKTDQDDWL